MTLHEVICLCSSTLVLTLVPVGSQRREEGGSAQVTCQSNEHGSFVGDV